MGTGRGSLFDMTSFLWWPHSGVRFRRGYIGPPSPLAVHTSQCSPQLYNRFKAPGRSQALMQAKAETNLGVLLRWYFVVVLVIIF